jgi:hypothetical protein
MSRIVLRGPAALVALIAMAAGVWWSFDHTAERVARYDAAELEFLTIETPGLAEQLAVQQQRMYAETGHFTSDADLLLVAWATQLGDDAGAIAALASRHAIAATAGRRGFTVTARVGRGGGVYTVAVDLDARRVTRTCDGCPGSTWPAGIDDRHMLGPA